MKLSKITAIFLLAFTLIGAGYALANEANLPHIKKHIRRYLPGEAIDVEQVGKSIALSGNISDAASADRAIKIVKQYISDDAEILNFMKVKTTQQVMLRVRVGELKRDTLKSIQTTAGNPNTGSGGLTTGFTSILNPTLLEHNGVFKVLAEPNLVSMSGEPANFLAGGEFPVPVPGNNDSVTVTYKPFGVKVGFTPFVISPNKIRMVIEPEVSEITSINTIEAKGYAMPSVSTNRTKTTVELAPGESFMISGLIRDDVKARIRQIPGLGDIPILGALFRSAGFARNETELVIAVTPYLVDPVISKDLHLPTDDFAPASMLDMMFFGKLGAKMNSSFVFNSEDMQGTTGYMVD